MSSEDPMNNMFDPEMQSSCLDTSKLNKPRRTSEMMLSPVGRTPRGSYMKGMLSSSGNLLNSSLPAPGMSGGVVGVSGGGVGGVGRISLGLQLRENKRMQAPPSTPNVNKGVLRVRGKKNKSSDSLGSFDEDDADDYDGVRQSPFDDDEEGDNTSGKNMLSFSDTLSIDKIPSGLVVSNSALDDDDEDDSIVLLGEQVVVPPSPSVYGRDKPNNICMRKIQGRPLERKPLHTNSVHANPKQEGKDLIAMAMSAPSRSPRAPPSTPSMKLQKSRVQPRTPSGGRLAPQTPIAAPMPRTPPCTPQVATKSSSVYDAHVSARTGKLVIPPQTPVTASMPKAPPSTPFPTESESAKSSFPSDITRMNQKRVPRADSVTSLSSVGVTVDLSP